tara:strand:+ start:66 stop:515 length:450 start_codon:yes stop_codon:yes gene_type:complete
MSFGARQGEEEFTKKIQTVLSKRIWEQDEQREREEEERRRRGSSGSSSMDGTSTTTHDGSSSSSSSSTSSSSTSIDDTGRIFSTSKVGIAGIQRAAKTKQRRNVKMTKEAFGDLESLMEQAKHMVDLIERYTATAKSSSSSSSNPEADK